MIEQYIAQDLLPLKELQRRLWGPATMATTKPATARPAETTETAAVQVAAAETTATASAASPRAATKTEETGKCGYVTNASSTVTGRRALLLLLPQHQQYQLLPLF